MAVRDRYIDIKARLMTESPTIIDGGANNGSTTDYFLRHYKAPVIHAFEPIPELVVTLKQKFAKQGSVTTHGAAIGAKAKTVSFNVLNNLVSSSVLNPSALNKRIHGEKMDVRQVVEVPQVRLEHVMQNLPEIDLLKLDLQGYELEALKGCGSLLERIKIITTEIEFVPFMRASLYLVILMYFLDLTDSVCLTCMSYLLTQMDSLQQAILFT